MGNDLKPRICHACQGEVPARGPAPADGLSTCGACREAGIDPRDVEKLRLFDLWVRDCVRENPDAPSQSLADVWGWYLCYVTLLDAENYLGRQRLADLLEARGVGHRVKRFGYGGVDILDAREVLSHIVR